MPRPGDVSSGSKSENLHASKCFQLFTQQRTSPRYFGMSVSCQQRKSPTLPRISHHALAGVGARHIGELALEGGSGRAPNAGCYSSQIDAPTQGDRCPPPPRSLRLSRRTHSAALPPTTTPHFPLAYECPNRDAQSRSARHTAPILPQLNHGSEDDFSASA